MKEDLDVLFPPVYFTNEELLREIDLSPGKLNYLVPPKPRRLHVGWRHTLANLTVRILVWLTIAFFVWQFIQFLITGEPRPVDYTLPWR